MGHVNLYKPHAKQLEIHSALDEVGKYYFVSIGRQFGKTLLGENQALKWAIENQGWKIAWISPTYKQCKKVFTEMNRALDGCPMVSSVNHSDLVFTIDTKSTIQFYSAEAYDTIRGETFDAGVGDEMAFWKPEAWNEVIKATLLVRGKKWLGMSTPKGKNYFYGLIKLADVTDNYRSFYGTSYDNPYIDPQEIEDARLSLPDHIFRQEYLAEFLEDASSVFRNIPEAIKKGRKTAKYFAGIDLGRADDYTVLTIVNEQDEEVFCERWRHIGWNVILDNVASELNKWKPITMVETNGMQDVLMEQIQAKINFHKGLIQPFVTTSRTKQEIIENLIVKFEQKEIGILGLDFQKHELEIFTYEYNPRTRNIKYTAPTGLHDDYVMSRAIASRALKSGRNRGTYTLR